MSTHLCPHCGVGNTTTARFCANCGKTLSPPAAAATPAFCPQCSAPLRPGMKFCPTCGYNFSQPLAAPAGAAPAGAPPAGAPPPAGVAPPAGASPGAGATRMIGGAGEIKQLIVRWMGGGTQNFPLTKPVMQLGRAPDNDIVINHPAVSGHHLTIATTPQGLTVTDLNSTNGTQLNGQKIPPGPPAPFRPGDIIRIGDLNGNWVGLALEGDQGEAVRTLALGKLDLSTISRAMIGRDPTSYLPLSHPSVSFRHAEIFKQNDDLMIRDLGSTNGTFVNGQRISQVPLEERRHDPDWALQAGLRRPAAKPGAIDAPGASHRRHSTGA